MTITLRPHQKEAIDTLSVSTKGQLIVPTGGGKTLIAITDAIRRLELSTTPITIVVVAPRILLANQLCSEFMEQVSERIGNVIVGHVHSGETKHFSTTKSQEIADFVNMTKLGGLHTLLFTTYHSLGRIQQSGVGVDTVYFDEAHNSVQRHFYKATEYFSQEANRAFFFTATPKHSRNQSRPGMNNVQVYGDTIVNVSAPSLVNQGFIIPPYIATREMNIQERKNLTPQFYGNIVLDSVDDYRIKKMLVCAQSVAQITRIVNESDLVSQLNERGYSVMYISAKTGGVIDGRKVRRDEFFRTLNTWGKDDNKHFVIFHHSILSEGINVSGLEGTVMLRTMDNVTISQTIGRVIRLHPQDAIGLRSGELTPGKVNTYKKGYGLVIVPTFSKSSKKVEKNIQGVVDLTFKEGQPSITYVR